MQTVREHDGEPPHEPVCRAALDGGELDPEPRGETVLSSFFAPQRRVLLRICQPAPGGAIRVRVREEVLQQPG